MADGVEIALHEFLPPVPPRACAVVLHGAGMSSKLYFTFANILCLQGIAVTLVDQRGHGESTGEPGWVAHEEQYADDLVQCVRAIAGEAASLPLFLLAHSVGCAIALKALPRLGVALAGLALLTPTFSHDPLLIRRRYGHPGGSRMRYGVATRPPRSVPDAQHQTPRFHLGVFALARLLRIGARRPALVFPSLDGAGPAYSYSSGAVVAHTVRNVAQVLGGINFPVFLATGERDSEVDDAAIQTRIPWMLSPRVSLCSHSYAGANHFTVTLHAVRDLVAWVGDHGACANP